MELVSVIFEDVRSLYFLINSGSQCSETARLSSAIRFCQRPESIDEARQKQ